MDKTKNYIATEGMNLKVIRGERMNKTENKIESTISGEEIFGSAMNHFGIEVLDAKGKIKSTTAIFESLCRAWGDLDETQKNELAELVAGKRTAKRQKFCKAMDAEQKEYAELLSLLIERGHSREDAQKLAELARVYVNVEGTSAKNAVDEITEKSNPIVQTVSKNKSKRKSSSKFDYMNFYNSCYDVEFVAHAEKFTKEQALEYCITENDWLFKYNGILRNPTLDDITKRYVRWYPKVPDWCDFESDDGCYSYCNNNDKGSFPVWVIDFDLLGQ